MNAFKSEIIKLNRKAMRWLLVGMGFVGAIAAGFSIASASGSSSLPRGGPGMGVALTKAAIAEANGLGRVVGQVGGILGALTLAAAASVVASEYSLGTWKNLFVREPRTGRLLTGKLAALAAYLSVGTILSAIVATITAFVVAESRGISTSEWLSSSGLTALGASVFNLILASIAYGTIGTMLAVLFRSPVAAIGAGLAYILPGENILGLASSTVKKFLPGQVFSAAGGGGTDLMQYRSAMLMLALYVCVALGVSLWRFNTRELGG
jgi:ABC-2 type transport system permease protein